LSSREGGSTLGGSSLRDQQGRKTGKKIKKWDKGGPREKGPKRRRGAKRKKSVGAGLTGTTRKWPEGRKSKKKRRKESVSYGGKGSPIIRKEKKVRYEGRKNQNRARRARQNEAEK